ncbi:MAG: GTPase domain-containing protein [Alicyclobacillus macrosporangiidus]|uniref:GTPase n=1 Tax=Alicyclobacillus macrosporangiidus TaxID=392015 RepID=UPI0026EEACBF|nr:GTPase domain-containing protein [Alicyclobacillus macrosporangiidus]MCL6599502.1 GTPase domain-containing protein [Alicyclobacillus macrosporangiidus]
MKRSLVIGKTNVGKTLFCIHFARYMGVRELRWLVEEADGRTDCRLMSLAEAEASLSDAHPHRTRCLQSVAVEFPAGKTVRQLLLTDTTGLTEGIHPEQALREAMAQTLRAMTDANLILHMVDAGAIGRALRGQVADPSCAWDALESQLAEFGMRHGGYVLLANKMDLPGAMDGYRFLCKRYSRQRVLPVSALHGTGFREVKQVVWRFA